MAVPLLLINGVGLDVPSCDGLTQSYELFGGAAVLRTLNGSGIKQAHWQKIRTRITGEGRLPPALAGMDFNQAYTLGCVVPRRLFAVGNALSLPAGRRADLEPFGFASRADGFPVRTPGVLVGDVLTLTPVTGAVGYTFAYYPLLTVFSEPPAEHGDARTSVKGWDLTAEEI